MEDDDDFLEYETINVQIFHNNVREQVIFLLLFFCLYLVSYTIIDRFKRRGNEDYYSCDEDEITVYRISTWLCSFSLAVSIGSVLLLPISIISNEVLVNYPGSYYIKWLKSSLIQGLWNYVFLFSNLSMFVFLPFAYLFTESEGFFGHRKRLLARVSETFIVLILLAIMVLGITYVLGLLLNKDELGAIPVFNFWSYLPFLYSCISFVGTLILLVCTPLGFIRLFDVVGNFLIKPQFLLDLNEQYLAHEVEEECLIRKLKLTRQSNGQHYMAFKHAPTTQYVPDSPELSEYIAKWQNCDLQAALNKRLTECERKRKNLDKKRRTSFLQRNIFYPLAMVLLITLTGLAVLLVVQNTLSLLIGIKALPSSSKQFTLGVSSLSKLGPFGAVLEITMILYFIATSSVGLYTSPYVRKLKPVSTQTPFVIIMANCGLVLIISSALPVLSKILGITNFDLLGDFGSIEWLGNFKIVLLYNVLFVTASSLCIVSKFTAKVRRELYARLVENYNLVANWVSFLN